MDVPRRRSMPTFDRSAPPPGVTLGPGQIKALERYRDAIVEWNMRSNLTAVRDPAGIERVLIFDSLRLAPLVMPSDATGPSRLIDVGSGASIPGIPLKIALGDRLEVSLLDSNRKKSSFLSHVVGVLGAATAGTRVLSARAEEAGRSAEHGEAYDYVTARAVGSIRLTAELCLPFARVGGVVVLPRGRDWAVEVQEASNAIAVVGGRVRTPDGQAGSEKKRSTIILDKVAETPDRFPRRVGVPRKRPL